MYERYARTTYLKLYKYGRGSHKIHFFGDHWRMRNLISLGFVGLYLTVCFRLCNTFKNFVPRMVGVNEGHYGKGERGKEGVQEEE